jgi:hypothetical protein
VVAKSEIRNSKSETNSKLESSKSQTGTGDRRV